jgi:hypothetical protein
MKTEIDHVKLGNGQEIRVVEEGREGSTVFVRPLGEKEIDRGETVYNWRGKMKRRHLNMG